MPQPATHSQRLGLAIQVLMDFVSILLGFAATVQLGIVLHLKMRQESAAWPSLKVFPSPALGLLFLYGVLFTLLGYSERLYDPEIVRSAREERVVLLRAVFLATLIVATSMAWLGSYPLVLSLLAVGSPCSLLTLSAWRECRRRYGGGGMRAQGDVRNVLILGAGRLGQRLARSLEQDGMRKRVVRGFLDDTAPLGGPIRGRVSDLARLARSEFVDEIILTLPPQSSAALRAVWEARRNRIDVRIVPDLLGFDASAVMLERFGDIPVLTLCEERIPTFGLLLKRGLDVTCSLIALLVMSPLLAAIALAIRLDSPGPLLYRAPRLGLKGRRFLCCKFRTMSAEADKLKEQLRMRNEREGPFFKLANDPRVTRVGRLLRRYSLDELPQLWNVWCGEMSLVGPRPHPIDDFERYRLEDWQRLEVLPGMTGLWQVTARGDPSFERGMTLDREYIGSWNLWVDLKILCKTFAVVLRGEGA